MGLFNVYGEAILGELKFLSGFIVNGHNLKSSIVGRQRMYRGTDQKVNGRDSKEINIILSYKGWDVVERQDLSLPERKEHMTQEKSSL